MVLAQLNINYFSFTVVVENSKSSSKQIMIKYNELHILNIYEHNVEIQGFKIKHKHAPTVGHVFE